MLALIYFSDGSKAPCPGIGRGITQGLIQLMRNPGMRNRAALRGSASGGGEPAVMDERTQQIQGEYYSKSSLLMMPYLQCGFFFVSKLVCIVKHTKKGFFTLLRKTLISDRSSANEGCDYSESSSACHSESEAS